MKKFTQEQIKIMDRAIMMSRAKGNGVLQCVSVSLRDYIATECMKSEIIAWNKEMSNEYRAKLLEDMIERYGNIKVNDAIALMSYEMADAMLSARSNER